MNVSSKFACIISLRLVGGLLFWSALLIRRVSFREKEAKQFINPHEAERLIMMNRVGRALVERGIPDQSALTPNEIDAEQISALAGYRDMQHAKNALGLIFTAVTQINALLDRRPSPATGQGR